jgi:hypothetical protein
MMSSTAWERPVLSPTLLHSVSSVAPYRYVTGHCSGARRVTHSAGAMLQSHCSCVSRVVEPLSTVATAVSVL